MARESRPNAPARIILLRTGETGSGKPLTRQPTEDASLEGMIQLPGGTFLMGTDDGEGPVRKITVNPFYISPYATTNAEFSTLVEETGYETEAERFGCSFVFYRFLSAKVKKKVLGAVDSAPGGGLSEEPAGDAPREVSRAA